MQHLLFHKRSLVLEPQIIQLVKENITRKRVIFHSIRFQLDKDTLNKIKQAQKIGSSLHISHSLRTDLRDYALFDSQSYLQAQLNFVSYYQQGNFEEAMVESIVSLDGNVIHKISSNCLENPEIAFAHYWLTEQLIKQLHFHPQEIPLNWLAWGLSLLIVAISILFNLEQWLQINPIMFLAPLLMLWLLQEGIKRLLILLLPNLRHWLLDQLLLNRFSRKMLLRFLGRIGL